ncbi:MAG: NUDIX domain-containing protein [Verrucomicrobia bacterium]|nr:NUDIX domain-containing protein [Verrucomicrobiota bacterium]
MPEFIDLPFCPHCGNRTFNSGPFKPWICDSCNFRLYPNVASAAAVFIYDEESRILFTERAHEPSLGKLGLPGGFLDAGETAESGILREIREEVGIPVTNLIYLGSFPNKYFYGGIHYDTLDLFFTARALSKEVKIDPTEVAAVHWKHRENIQEEDLAFPSFIQALGVLKDFKKKGV